MDTVLATADQVKNLKLDADVIISRGATANILRSCHDVPLVEIPLAGNDLIRCLHETKQLYGLKQLGIIGPMNMIYGAEGLSDIIGLKIKTYLMKNHEHIPQMVEKAVKDECEVIVGGIRTKEYAVSCGLNAVVPHTGKESLLQAITEAKRVAHISRVEQEKAQLFKTILDYAYEGVIAVNKNNAISVFNSSAQKMLQIGVKETSGRKAGEIIPKGKLRSLLQEEGEHLDEIIGYNDIQLAVNKIPIMLKSENVGNVITFQNVTKIQELEGKIRQKIYTRGHVAKHTFDDIIGNSEKIRDTIETAERFSRVDSNILIIGDTGTGKELFSQSIHNMSPRKIGPFVAVNCAALPENLLESELFGYVEGAFTGAVRGGKPGFFELAHKGTIFLDEIAEVSLNLQGRLLRVIQEKEIMRLGHDRVIPVDVRIISATNKDLFDMVAKGLFREDLYYRLDVLKLNLPTLNERKNDIPLLIDNFIKNYAHLSDFKDISITDEAKNLLQRFNWRGNVRELSNACERLVVLSHQPVIDVDTVRSMFAKSQELEAFLEDISEDVYIETSYSNNKPEDLKPELNKQSILQALEKARYCKTTAARDLGISRVTLWRKMKELNIT